MLSFSNDTRFDDDASDIEARFLLKEGHCRNYTLAGKSIEGMQAEAKKVCDMMCTAFGLRVTELVADFVRDRDDRYWLTNVRSFLLEPSNYALKVKEFQHLIENQTVTLGKLRATANDSSKPTSLTPIAICNLCGFRFNRSTKGRRVTAHTLLALKEHLRRRGIDISINFTVRAEEFMSHTVTVCGSCYDVAIAEHQLIAVEREFALAQRIPAGQTLVDLGRKSEAEIAQVLPESTMHRWRVLFYVGHVITTSNCIHRMPDQMIGAFRKDKEYFFQLRFLKSITKFRLNLAEAPEKSDMHRVNAIRVQYFFSAAHNIDAMLKTTLAELRVTEGPDWDNAALSGRALLLQDFFPGYLSCPAMLSPKLSYLFGDEGKSNVAIQVRSPLSRERVDNRGTQLGRSCLYRSNRPPQTR